MKAPVLKTGTLSKPTKIASKILGFPGLPSPLSRLNRANSGHKNVYSERRFATPFPQRSSDSFPSFSTRGNPSERCLKFAGNHSPRYPRNLHSSIHRIDQGQSRSSLPQSFTPLDRTTGRLNVVREPRNCFSELFRFSESPKPDLVWLKQALGQQLGLAESGITIGRAHLPERRACEAGHTIGMAASGLALIGSSNSTSSTPVDRAPPSSRRRGKLQNRRVVTAMMELDHSTATNPAANVIPEHPHSAVTATAESAAELHSVLTAVNFRWDSRNAVAMTRPM